MRVVRSMAEDLMAMLGLSGLEVVSGHNGEDTDGDQAVLMKESFNLIQKHVLLRGYSKIPAIDLCSRLSEIFCC